jgi:hypothetical protein
MCLFSDLAQIVPMARSGQGDIIAARRLKAGADRARSDAAGRAARLTLHGEARAATLRARQAAAGLDVASGSPLELGLRAAADGAGTARDAILSGEAAAEDGLDQAAALRRRAAQQRARWFAAPATRLLSDASGWFA